MEAESPQQTQRTVSDDDHDLAAAFRAAPDVMCIVRADDAMMCEVNDLFSAVTGYTREDVVGKTSYDFPWWGSAEERDRILATLRDEGRLDLAEVRFVREEDGERVCLVSASPVTFRGERCVVWRAADITDQRRAEDAARVLEERLRQKKNLERLGMLTGGIAHDFNNLLVGVLGNADILLGMVEPDSPLARPLRAIAANAQNMADHTRELLDYAGRGSTKLVPLALDQVLERAVEVARSLSSCESRLTLSVASAANARVRGDAGQLTRMLINLIKNAAEAVEGPEGSVQVRLERMGDELEVRITDNGHGMDDATRASMFDPFFSTKTEGRGLGLSAAPMIVDRHGGRLHVESVPQVGTTVSVLLPVDDTPLGTTQAPLSARSTALRSGRVLVVDDEPEVRKVACTMLSQLGYDVREADGGEAALRLIETDSRAFTFVLLDATMPGTDGRQTLERVRGICPTLPVLLCSGYSATDFAALVAGQQHTSFLTKPFRVDQLEHAIASLLHEAEANA